MKASTAAHILKMFDTDRLAIIRQGPLLEWGIPLPFAVFHIDREGIASVTPAETFEKAKWTAEYYRIGHGAKVVTELSS